MMEFSDALKSDDEVLRGPGGRPAHEPTEKDRSTVKAMSAYGIPQEQIARVIGIHRETLAIHYRDELDLGVIEANAKIAETLFRQATKEGNTTALIWWSKARMGWKERQEMEHSGGINLQVVTGIDRAPDES
jgi:hypothetical protein